MSEIQKISELGFKIDKYIKLGKLEDLLFHDAHLALVEDYLLDNKDANSYPSLKDEDLSKVFQSYDKKNMDIISDNYLDFYNRKEYPHFNSSLLNFNKELLESKYVENKTTLVKSMVNLMEQRFDIYTIDAAKQAFDESISENEDKTKLTKDALKDFVLEFSDKSINIDNENLTFSSISNKLVDMFSEAQTKLDVKLNLVKSRIDEQNLDFELPSFNE